MKKCLLLLFFTLFSFSAIHAKIDWKLENGTLTISGRNIYMPNYEIAFDTPWYDDRLKIETVVIEDGVINIGKNAFFDCSNLSSITIPNSVTSIGDNAFYGCSGLTSVTIGNSVKTIGVAAFNGCSSLTSVTIGNSVTSIGGAAFAGCSSLTSITIPNSVTSIGQAAFKGCSSLTSITIPNSVTSIGDFAFEGCSNLTSITIGNSVTSIGDLAFVDCSSLTTIIVEEGNTKYDSRDNCNAIIETKSNTLILGCKNSIIPNSVTSIGENAFSDCSGLTSITIPNSVTSIGDWAFHGCLSLTSISIPNSVTSIGENAFHYSGLTSITIPNSVASIGEYAFSLCSGLTSVIIPSSVTSIGKSAFWGCSGLTSITFEGSKHPEFGDDVFGGVNKSIPVYVPASSREEYKNALKNFGLSNIKALPLYLTDGKAYTQDSQVDDVDVTYTRNFTHTNWQALYLPFSLSYDDWKDDFEIAYISAVRQEDIDDDGKIDNTILEFVKINSGSTAPNTPYIIKAKSTGEKTLSAKNATVYQAEKNSVDCSTTAAKFIFTGTYIPAAFLPSRPYYALSGGKLERLNATAVYPYRWYMKIESRNSGYAKYYAAKEITISVIDDEEVTGISQMQMENRQSSVYDMNGRKVNENNLKPGMYVKNGKKFVVK